MELERFQLPVIHNIAHNGGRTTEYGLAANPAQAVRDTVVEDTYVVAGGIGFYTIVGAVVFITLLLVTGSTMAMAVRERTDEIGVLKTLGYSDLLLLMLVLSESILYALVGGGLGLMLAKLYTLGGDPTKGMLRIFYLSPLNIIAGLLVTMAVGVVSGIIPALHAMRLNIVDALRRV